MGQGHHHHHHGWHGHGFDLWPWLMLLATLLVGLYLLWVLLRTRNRIRGPWRAAVARHRDVAVAYAAYECDPLAVLRRPALADVRVPATARFVDAFAEAGGLLTDRYPGRERAAAFLRSVERAEGAWTTAVDVAAASSGEVSGRHGLGGPRPDPLLVLDLPGLSLIHI